MASKGEKVLATERLARFVVDTTYTDIPQEAIRIAKELSLDCLGCTLAGSVHETGRIVIKHTREIGGTPEAGVIGGGFQTSAANAAFANGIMAHALDYDDFGFSGHPSVVVLPVLLALGEKLKSSGKEIMEAHAVGFEVYGKMGAAFNELYSRGWHPTAIFGVMGAAAAAAKLLKLNFEQTEMAFGIAASEIGGLKENLGTMTKPLHAGHAAKCGVVAAMLAKDGFTARDDIVENPVGFAFAFGGEGFDLEKMVKDLGNPFRIVTAGPAIKKYPCCGSNHRALDAILYLIKEHNIRYDDVESVTVGVNAYVPKVLIYSEAKNGHQGRFCLQYNMAAALVDGKVDRDTFADEKVRSPRMQEAMKKIKVEVHPEWPTERNASSIPVTVRLKDGREYTHKVDIARGHPKFPLKMEEILAKYRDNARLVLSPEQVERSIQLVLTLEEQRDLAQLMGIVVLTAPQPS